MLISIVFAIFGTSAETVSVDRTCMLSGARDLLSKYGKSETDTIIYSWESFCVGNRVGIAYNHSNPSGWVGVLDVVSSKIVDVPLLNLASVNGLGAPVRMQEHESGPYRMVGGPGVDEKIRWMAQAIALLPDGRGPITGAFLHTDWALVTVHLGLSIYFSDGRSTVIRYAPNIDVARVEAFVSHIEEIRSHVTPGSQWELFTIYLAKPGQQETRFVTQANGIHQYLVFKEGVLKSGNIIPSQEDLALCLAKRSEQYPFEREVVAQAGSELLLMIMATYVNHDPDLFMELELRGVAQGAFWNCQP